MGVILFDQAELESWDKAADLGGGGMESVALAGPSEVADTGPRRALGRVLDGKNRWTACKILRQLLETGWKIGV